MHTINVYYNKCAHTSRVLTGFHMLETNNRIKLKMIENTDNYRGFSFQNLQAEIDNEMLVSFDMGDRWWLAHDEGSKYLDLVDAYFARSYTSNSDMRKADCDRNINKVHPFGFDYYATYSGNPMDATVSKKKKLLSTVRKVSGYEKCMHVPYFEGKADEKEKDFKIIFMTRLWNPEEVNLKEPGISQEIIEYRKYMIEERYWINEQRIKIVKELQKNFGSRFTGGIYADSFANKKCPEIVLDKSQVRKKAYLDKMKESDICIGSVGLHQSIGWKTGEYVAAARAIIAEEFVYQVPGNFDDGNHYIPFNNAEGCLEAVEKLYNDADRIYKMKKANETYYEQYLKPDQQIRNALVQIGVSV